MDFIEFGELRTEHLCIILLLFVYVCLNFFRKSIEKFSNDPFIDLFSMFLGELYCGIFIPIIKYLNKSEISHTNDDNSSEANTNNDKTYQINKRYSTFIYIKEEYKEINPRFNMIIICLITFIDFLGEFRSLYLDYDKALNKEIDIIFILIILALNFFILDMQIYRHHKLMIILIIILGLIINYIQYLSKGQQTIGINDFISSLQLIMHNFIAAFSPVISKFLMDKNHCSPFKILFFSGIFGIIYILFFSFFYHSITGLNNRNFYESIFENVIYHNIKDFLFWNLNNFVLSLFTFLTVKFLEPTNLILAVFSAKPIAKLIDSFTESDSSLKLYDIIMYILYFIFIFCCLIFNEFIILNFCGLNKFTKKGICDRGEKEVLDMLFQNDSFSSN